MPGAPVLIFAQRTSGLVYVAGTTAHGVHQVWAIEPHFEVRGSIEGKRFEHRSNISRQALDASATNEDVCEFFRWDLLTGLGLPHRKQQRTSSASASVAAPIASPHAPSM